MKPDDIISYSQLVAEEETNFLWGIIAALNQTWLEVRG
jgi:hypothetical protein